MSTSSDQGSQLRKQGEAGSPEAQCVPSSVRTALRRCVQTCPRRHRTGQGEIVSIFRESPQQTLRHPATQ
ncbi:hypothetical protein BaRGS_00021649 [Batillaria attramentaria]|uniref:Uncharacterized protein n=1 Tax=Batillaria attramentaria TaxID=370345 RepID=A0ABD0KJ01_9CAEN